MANAGRFFLLRRTKECSRGTNVTCWAVRHSNIENHPGLKSPASVWHFEPEWKKHEAQRAS